MIRLIAGGIAIVWAYSGWKNLPRLDHPSAMAAWLAIAGTCVLCYFLGARQTRATAIASAMAKAEAHAAALASSSSNSSAQVLVQVAPEFGARSRAMHELDGLDRAAWIGAPKQVAEQDVMAMAMEDGGLDLEAMEVEG